MGPIQPSQHIARCAERKKWTMAKLANKIVPMMILISHSLPYPSITKSYSAEKHVDHVPAISRPFPVFRVIFTLSSHIPFVLFFLYRALHALRFDPIVRIVWSVVDAPFARPRTFAKAIREYLHRILYPSSIAWNSAPCSAITTVA